MLHIKRFTAVFLVLLLIGSFTHAQKSAVISTEIQTFDFGVIAEAEGLATHRFVIKNTGVAPL